MKGPTEIYEALSKPPSEALKTIKGGRLSGMTDIKPQWRYRAMTEMFGLCGFAWKYTVDKQWLEPVEDGQVIAFVNVSLFIWDGEWSAPIPGSGGSMLVAKEKSGLYASDEAYKMATTDALSVAMKMIGVAAAIYEGHDPTKHTDREPVRKDAPQAMPLQVQIRNALTELGKRAPAEVIEDYRAKANTWREHRDEKSGAALLEEIKAWWPKAPSADPDKGINDGIAIERKRVRELLDVAVESEAIDKARHTVMLKRAESLRGEKSLTAMAAELETMLAGGVIKDEPGIEYEEVIQEELY